MEEANSQEEKTEPTTGLGKGAGRTETPTAGRKRLTAIGTSDLEQRKDMAGGIWQLIQGQKLAMH